MSFDKSYTEYHLTPRGWKKGLDYFMNAKPEIEPPIPNDRKETWARIMTQKSVWSREEVKWEQIWPTSEPSDDVVALRRKFGKPCEDFPDNDM